MTICDVRVRMVNGREWEARCPTHGGLVQTFSEEWARDVAGQHRQDPRKVRTPDF